MNTSTPRKCIIPKGLLVQNFFEIDSFAMFKNKERIDLIKASKDRMSLMIPQFDLIATLQDDNSLKVQFNNGFYTIKVETKVPNYGGIYFFFICCECSVLSRKLYCINGRYICRRKQCANLGYYSQKLNVYDRLIYNQIKIEDVLKNKGGSLEIKPPWIKQRTHTKLQLKHQQYDQIHFKKAEAAFAQQLGLKPITYHNFFQ